MKKLRSSPLSIFHDAKFGAVWETAIRALTVKVSQVEKEERLVAEVANTATIDKRIIEM